MTKADRVFLGDIVTPTETIRSGFVAAAGEVITAVGAGAPPAASEVVDWCGKLIFPGIVDGHMHTSIHGWEGIDGATRAAAAGGVTTVVDMPYDTPRPVTNVAVLKEKLDKVARHAHIDIALYGTVPTAIKPDDIAALVEAGISAFKLSTYEVNRERFPRFTPALFLVALKEIAKTGLPVGIHNEDQELVDTLIAEAVKAGRTEAIMHCRTRPPISETLANLQVFELGLETGAHVHLAHSSIAGGFDLAEWYRARGSKASAETCLHYLVLTEDDVVRQGGRARCNPPLRPQSEVEAVWKRLVDDKVAYVSSDHAPWPLSRKQSANIFECPSGLTALQDFGSLMYSVLVERGLSANLLALYCSERSARFHGLYPKKGRLAAGSDCDLMVIDPTETLIDERASVDEPQFQWSPYDGRKVRGRVAATVLRGRLVYDGSRVLADAGLGQFVNRRKVMESR